MNELLEQLIAKLSEQIAANTLRIVEKRLDAHAKETETVEKFYTVKEAAARLGVGTETIYRKTRSGELGFSRSIKNQTIIFERHIDEYHRRREVRAVRVGRAERDNVVLIGRAA